MDTETDEQFIVRVLRRNEELLRSVLPQISRPIESRRGCRRILKSAFLLLRRLSVPLFSGLVGGLLSGTLVRVFVHTAR